MTNNKRFMNNTDTPINEREIVLRLIDGDEDAFCELYATYKNRLLYFAMRFVKSRDFAEDIFRMPSLSFGKDAASLIPMPLFPPICILSCATASSIKFEIWKKKIH